MNEVRARTVATTVLVAMGLYLIIVLESSSRVRGYTVGALCLALLALYLVVLSLPGWRDFFEVAAPDAGDHPRARWSGTGPGGGRSCADRRALPPGLARRRREAARSDRSRISGQASTSTALVTHQAPANGVDDVGARGGAVAVALGAVNREHLAQVIDLHAEIAEARRRP